MKRLHMVCSIVACVILASSLAMSAGKEIFVDDQSLRPGQGPADNPFDSWDHAAHVITGPPALAAMPWAKPEDTINIRNGPYTNVAIDVNVGNQPLTFIGWPGTGGGVVGKKECAHAVLQGTGTKPVFTALGQLTVRHLDVTMGGGRASGGGFQLDHIKATIDDCCIYSNAVRADGGGIWAFDPESLTIVNCQIYDNHASGSGGGLYALAGTCTIDSCAFSRNTADRAGGGALFEHHITATVTGSQGHRSTFSDNHAGVYGGGVASRASGPLGEETPELEIDNSDFTRNKALAGPGGAIAMIGTQEVFAGAFTALGGSKATIHDVSIGPDNSASGGSRAYSYGGGIFVQGSGSSCAMTGNVDVSHNHSDFNGGGLAILAFATVNSRNTRTRDNTADGTGGGIYASVAPRVGFRGGDLTHNTAQGFGGGSEATCAAQLTLDGVDVVDNTSVTGRGGGISGREASVKVYHCQVHRNHALAAEGGGVSAFKRKVEEPLCNSAPTLLLMDDATVEGNETARVGSGISCERLRDTAVFVIVRVTNCTVQGNTSTGDPTSAIGIYFLNTDDRGDRPDPRSTLEDGLRAQALGLPESLIRRLLGDALQDYFSGVRGPLSDNIINNTTRVTRHAGSDVVLDTASAIIEDSILDSSPVGVDLRGASASIAHCLFMLNSRQDINLNSRQDINTLLGSSASVRFCTLVGEVGSEGLLVDGLSTGSIHLSNISGHVPTGLRPLGAGVENDNGPVELSATENWWGDPSGPSPNGSGDRVLGNVDVDPWRASVVTNAVPR